MNQLSQGLSSKITAEQVITDVVSVVKELFENAVDAKATHVTVSLLNFGLQGLEVTDNGSGIPSSDFPLLCKDNCTSKMSSFENITQVSTLGFRGQALGSLAKMASVQITTRHFSAEVGHTLQFDHQGEVLDKCSLSREVGTSVKVTNLFNWMPVRKENLTKRKTFYLKKIQKLIEAYCLVHTDKKIKLLHLLDKKKDVLIDSVPCKATKDKVSMLFGREFAKHLEEFNLACGSTQVTGLFSRIDSQTNLAGQFQFLFVNSRYVSAPPNLKKAISAIVKEFTNKTPNYLIKIEGNSCDFNLTPDKMEVYLDREEEIVLKIKEQILKLCSQSEFNDTSQLKRKKSSLQETPKKAKLDTAPTKKFDIIKKTHSDSSSCILESSDFKANPQPVLALESGVKIGPQPVLALESGVKIGPQPVYTPKATPQLSTSEVAKLTFQEPANKQLKWDIKDALPQKPNTQPVPLNLPTGCSASNESPDTDLAALASQFKKCYFSELKIIGQFNRGFILTLLPSTQDLFIIDQHAANEKYLFETLQKTTTIHKQNLLKPIKLNLDLPDQILVKKFMPAFEHNGFCLEDRTQGIWVTALPYSKNSVFKLDDLYEMINKAREIGWMEDLESLAKLIRPFKFRSLFASRACRKAVMIGDVLDFKTMTSIVRSLEGLEQPWNCPHGRPTLRFLRNVSPCVPQSTISFEGINKFII